MTRSLTLLVALVAGAALVAAPASARSVAVGAPAGLVVAHQYRYVPGDTSGNVPVDLPLRLQQGARLLFTNADPAAPHTLTAVPEGETYRFDTPIEVQPGETREVEGISSLDPGTYTFFCKLHTWLMQGQLEIVPAVAGS